jgi:hypothetical protein
MTIHEPRRRSGGVPAPGGPPLETGPETGPEPGSVDGPEGGPADTVPPEPAPGADAAGGVQPGDGGDGGDGAAEAPGLPARVLRLLTVLGACLVAIAEIDRLTAGLRDAEDRSVSLLALVGSGRAYGFATGGGETFGRLHQGGILSGTGIRWWLVLYAVLHLVAVVSFVALARRGLGLPRLVGGERPPGARDAAPGLRRRLRARLAVDLDERRGPATVLALVLLVWLVVDTLVVVLAALAGDTGRAGGALTGDVRELELDTTPRLVADAVGWGATAGWLLVLLAVAMLVRRLVLGVRLESGALWRPELRRVRRAGRALYIHRFSLVVVAVIGGLVVLPGGEILDQFPDAARAWVDPDGSGAWHAVWGVVSLLALTTVVFVLGRLRSTLAYHRYARAEPERDPSLWAHAAWLAVPALVAAAGWLVARRGWGAVDAGALIAFALPIVAIVLLSLVVRFDVVPRLWRPVRRLLGRAWRLVRRTSPAAPSAAPDTAPPPAAPPARRIPPIDEADAFALLVWKTGDVLALALVAVASVGLVRAFTAPFALGSASPASPGPDVPATIAFAVGVVLAAAWWPLAATLLRAQDRPSTQQPRGLQWLALRLRPDERPTGRAGVVDAAIALVLAAAALAGLGGLLLYPFTWAAALGVVAVTAMGLGCVVVLVSVAVLRVQRTRPLEVFSLVGLRRTPLLTLVLAVPVAASLTGGDPDVHSIRTLPAAQATTPAERPVLDEAFRTWLTSRPGCTGAVTVTGRRLPVRPMVLVAAAGGGIRAATWTAYGVDHLAAACGDRPVFLSSGVSGGSLGLALARQPTGAGAAAERLAEQTALSAAVDGLVVRDLLGGATGIRVYDRDHEPRPEWQEPQREWLDRAGLMEREWESAAPELARPFLSGPGTSGYLLLNSTSVGTACRMIVSDIGFPAGAEGGYTRRAEVTTATQEQDPDCHTPVTGLPAGSVDLLQAYGCLGPLRASTAAMLSARFPYVTPSGVVPGCRDAVTTQQLVDGGYAEATGLGTLVDLAPELMRLVRGHNAEVLGDASSAGPLVVPTVVFLQNHFGTDLSAPPSASSSELLVPPVARRAKNELGSDAALRQRLEALFADAVPCPPKPAACVAAGATGVPPYVLVAPATLPSVTAPLGWTLSQTSIDRLRTAMTQQATCTGEPADGQPPRLCDLLRTLKPPRQP